MNNFNFTELKNICADILDRRGITPKKLGGDFIHKKGKRVISAKLIKNNIVDFTADQPRFVSDTIYKKWMKTPLYEGDVLLTSEAPSGSVAYIKETKEWCLGQRLFCLRPNPSIVYGKYLFYVLQTKKLQHDINARSTGTTVSGIRQSELVKIVIPLPPLPTQKMIAEILGTLDEKIAINKKTNKNLEEIAKALFKSWFIDFDPVRAKAEDRSNGLPNAISELFPDSFEDSELGRIPKGWKIKTADQLCEVITKGTTPTSIGGQFSDEGIPFYKVESISESGQIIPGKYSFIDNEVDLLLKRSRIIEGDILFSIAGTIGRTTLMRKENVPANTNQALAILRPNSNLISSEFMYLYLQDKKRIELARSRVVQSVQANFSLGELKSLPLVVPSESLRKRFEGIIEKLFDKITITHNNSIHLTKIRNALLPKLISGELRIPDAEKMIEDAEI